ncbi:MAG: zinc transporter ZupT [Turicibacter sp.]|nr:zinc transporter ZupT [Turicibacter sp.]
MENGVLFAFLLTLFAGLSTVLGGLVVFLPRKNNANFLAVSLSFAAGVMIYISFVEIFAGAVEMFENYHEDQGNLFATLSFFGGIAFIAIIDRLLPHEDDTAAFIDEKDETPKITERDKKTLRRLGIMTALAIAIHNFPEGLVTFMSALYNPALGITIAIAIAIHNIPEGIAIAVPIQYATGSKAKAVLASLLSGITEPLGAIVAYFILLQWFDDVVFGIVFAAVGGIMVYISLEQLLPSAYKFGKTSQVTLGLFIGMIVMAGSLILLG